MKLHENSEYNWDEILNCFNQTFFMSYQARILVLLVFMDDTHPRGDVKLRGPGTQWVCEARAILANCKRKVQPT